MTQSTLDIELADDDAEECQTVADLVAMIERAG